MKVTIDDIKKWAHKNIEELESSIKTFGLDGLGDYFYLTKCGKIDILKELLKRLEK